MPGLTSAGILLIVFLTIGSAISVMVAPLLTVVVPNELRASQHGDAQRLSAAPYA